MGNTKVLAAVYGPREVTMKSKELHDRAYVTVEVTTLPFASGEHKKRSRGDRQIAELSSMLRETVEALLFTTVYPRCDVTHPRVMQSHTLCTRQRKMHPFSDEICRPHPLRRQIAD